MLNCLQNKLKHLVSGHIAVMFAINNSLQTANLLGTNLYSGDIAAMCATKHLIRSVALQGTNVYIVTIICFAVM
jgi:hypothetical protein